MNYRKGLSILLAAVMVTAAGLGGSYAETAGQGRGNSEAAAPAGSYAETAVTGSAGTASDAAFADIGGHWAESAITEAAGLGIVGGYPDGSFLPDNLIKREEFFKLLTNILTEKPDTAGTVIRFTDIVDNEWYVPTIKIAVAAGITSGYGDGTFGVGLMISRQEAAKVAGSVISAYGAEGKTGVEAVLDKGKISEWAYDYVDLMFRKGYMRGDQEGNFRPTMALTRAEAATILLNIKKNELVIAANADELSAADSIAHNGQEGAFLRGDGTKSDPYEIATEEQLNHMRLHTTQGAFYVLKKNIAITKDYTVTPPAVTSGEPDWTEGNFAPIGTKEDPFRGSLFGNGYTISGLNISGTVGGNSNKTIASYAGLFGYLAPGSSVADVNIDASTITGNQYVGAVAGYNEGTVKNIQLGKKGIVNGKNYTGGLVGYSTQPLSSLRNRGTVTGTSDDTGGIVGYISAAGAVLQYCQNEGTVTGNESTGGIAGRIVQAFGAASKIVESYNKGTVQAGPYHAGGIAGTVDGGGYSYSLVISDSGNSGIVTGTGVIGGIAGYLKTGKTAVIRSINTGEVSGNSAGGIVGHNQGTVSYSYNSGKVEADRDGGGIAAYQQNGEGIITKSYNEGTVSAKGNAGGIVGENGSKVNNSYNSGKVSGTNSIGGIAGRNSGTVTNVYGSGTVSGDNVAGALGTLVGRNTGILSNSFWLETVGSSAAGLSDGNGNLTLVYKVTHEELSGQIKIRTTEGYKMLIDIMNANNTTKTDILNKAEPTPVWEYLYRVAEPSGGPENTGATYGGGIDPAAQSDLTDPRGNTIRPEDLDTKYLYPSIII